MTAAPELSAHHRPHPRRHRPARQRQPPVRRLPIRRPPLLCQRRSSRHRLLAGLGCTDRCRRQGSAPRRSSRMFDAYLSSMRKDQQTPATLGGCSVSDQEFGMLIRAAGAVLITTMALGCAAGTNDVSEYNNTYVGRLSDACYGDSRVEAHVANGIVMLLLPGRRDLQGSVTPDGRVAAAGTWSGDRGPVNAVLEGQISGKMFGRTLTATIHDGRCNPKFTLAPPQSKAS
jgi:hypothetical protein